MRKIGYLIVLSLFGCLFGCDNKSKSKKDCQTEDSIYVAGIGRVTPEEFEKMKDTLVYAEDEHIYMDRRTYKWSYEYPDTIKVAFTIDGKFIDSVYAERRGAIEDNLGHCICPAYVFVAGVGDVWTYDVDGNFVRFACSNDHSGAPCEYNP